MSLYSWTVASRSSTARRNLLLCLIVIFSPCLSYADTKTLLAEAIYIMGDGETPAFAESMAMQKAKQLALEKAGTYLQSTVVVKNQQLTSDEVQTLAGGLIKVEVLEKQRTIVEEGIRVSVKIRATVDADQAQSLSDRIKGKSVTADYKKLQEDYLRLGQEIDKWRQLVAKAPAAQEREAALDQIQEQQKKLALLQKREATLVQRIVSGETLAAKAEEQLNRRLNRRRQEQGALNILLQQILERGHLLTLGEPTIETSLETPQLVTVRVPVAVEPNPAMWKEILGLAKVQGWETVKFANRYNFGEGIPNPYNLGEGIAIRPGTDPEVLAAFQRALQSYSLMVKFLLRDGELACVDMDRFSLAQAGKFEVIPIMARRYGYVPIAGLVRNPILPSDEAELAIFGISPIFGWSKEEAVVRSIELRLMRSRSAAPGYIALLKGSSRLQVSVKMPLEIAKTITAVRVEFQKDLNPPPPALLLPRSGVEPCIIVEDKK